MNRCPHCHQPMPEPERVIRRCFDCQQPIRRHAKWTWQPRQGVLTIVHRHCENPESYEAAGEPVRPAAPLFEDAAPSDKTRQPGA